MSLNMEKPMQSQKGDRANERTVATWKQNIYAGWGQLVEMKTAVED